MNFPLVLTGLLSALLEILGRLVPNRAASLRFSAKRAAETGGNSALAGEHKAKRVFEWVAMF